MHLRLHPTPSLVQIAAEWGGRKHARGSTNGSAPKALSVSSVVFERRRTLPRIHSAEGKCVSDSQLHALTMLLRMISRG